MSANRVFVARMGGCAVFDPAGDRVGKVRDVLVEYRKSDAPIVVGLIVDMPGKRRVLITIDTVTSINGSQIITTGAGANRQFEQRGGEVRIIAEMLGRHVSFVDGSSEATIEDVAIEEHDPGEWAIDQLFVRRKRNGPSPFGKGSSVYVSWQEVRENDLGAAQSAEQLIATYSELNPADLANTLLDLPAKRRQQVVAELPDKRLADVLEELPDQHQVDIIATLDDDRAADVLDRMEPDDAADLIAQLPEEHGELLLKLMEPEEADDVRALLAYSPDTAGGLMTPEPIIMSADATVAEGLALIRRHDLPPTLGATVCLTLPPYEPPTGKFIGVVHFQRMLRYPPHERLGSLVDQSLEPISVHTSAAETSRILATYNLVSVPVVDEKQRLVGVVTVDDILDYLLPEDWRSNPEEVERAAAATHPLTSNLPIIRPTESPASTRGRSDRHGAT